MHRRSRVVQMSLALFVGGTLIPQPVDAEAAARKVRVKLIDYTVNPSVERTAVRRVTFVVHNADSVPHNLVVLRTRRRPHSLPVTGEHGRAREIGRVGATRWLHDEQTVRLRLSLRPGRYLLICNVPGHYQRGMVVRFRVRG
jgi:uncharacterized cupredoxin-like copper-binding protein